LRKGDIRTKVGTVGLGHMGMNMGAAPSDGGQEVVICSGMQGKAMHAYATGEGGGIPWHFRRTGRDADRRLGQLAVLTQISQR